MNYIVVDFEWNQAMSSKSSVFNKLPIRLRGEIIQIGAVRLDENMRPADEFHIDIKPVYFKRMHYKVKKLTGFDAERLSRGVGFAEALKEFHDWCGEDPIFITWGYDDKGIMEQNIIIHDLDWEWISLWINLQVVYSIQTNDDRNQTALSTAMAHFGIEQTRVAHDALGDAYNTALICSHLDMELGMIQHSNFMKMKEAKATHEKIPARTEASPICKHENYHFSSKGEAFTDTDFSQANCPLCYSNMTYRKWVNQGDGRYMNLADCPEHGKMLVRVKFKHAEETQFTASRLIYKADAAMCSFYEQKLNEPRRRRSGKGYANNAKK